MEEFGRVLFRFGRVWISTDTLVILPKIEFVGQILDDEEKWCHLL